MPQSWKDWGIQSCVNWISFLGVWYHFAQALCTRKEYKMLISLFRKASEWFLTNHAVYPDTQELATAAFLELHQSKSELQNSESDQDKRERVKMELRSMRHKLPFSKHVDDVMVYGLESFRCTGCQGAAAVSCMICRERVKGIKNEFHWTLFTRLLCIRAQSKAKNSSFFGSMIMIVSNMTNSSKSKNTTFYPSSDLENKRGTNIPVPEFNGADGLGSNWGLLAIHPTYILSVHFNQPLFLDLERWKSEWWTIKCEGRWIESSGHQVETGLATAPKENWIYPLESIQGTDGRVMINEQPGITSNFLGPLWKL